MQIETKQGNLVLRAGAGVVMILLASHSLFLPVFFNFKKIDYKMDLHCKRKIYWANMGEKR